VTERAAPSAVDGREEDDSHATACLTVRGMTCTGCEQRIAKALARLGGVVRSTAHHQTGRVRVVFDATRTSEAAVRSTIEQAGYEVSP
jgi:copper chaperone CopZ